MKNELILTIIPLILPACSIAPSEKTEINNMTASHQTQTSGSELKASGYTDVNGISMYYEIYGEGKPLVLIHGGGSTIHTSFGRLIPNLATTRRIIAVELQGHGHTSDRDNELSFEQDADDVAELLKKLNIPRADIFGFSNGGTTAVQLAIRNPDLVDHVVAASAILKRNGVPPQFWDFMKQATLNNMPDAYKRAAMSIHNDSVRLENMHDKCAKRMIQFKDISDEDLRSVKAPVLLVNGTSDVAIPEHVIQMSKLIPNCEYAIIPGGHGEYLGEITTLQAGKASLEILPILEKFLATDMK